MHSVQTAGAEGATESLHTRKTSVAHREPAFSRLPKNLNRATLSEERLASELVAAEASQGSFLRLRCVTNLSVPIESIFNSTKQATTYLLHQATTEYTTNAHRSP